jgi:hypothetical protein
MKLLFLVFALFTASAHASPEISQELKSEFERLRSTVSKLTPEYEVGGYLAGKRYGDHELLWHLAKTPGDPEVIRIYRDKGDSEQALDITFHHSAMIVRDRTVIRRFVGPAMTGWRGDTMDAATGEYLGSQGATQPLLDPRDRQILEQWGIRLF